MRKARVPVYRPPRWVLITAALAAAVFLVGAWLSYRTEGFTWLTCTFVFLLLGGLAGVLDALTQRIELHDEHLVVVRNLSRREYPRNIFVKAQWGKGVPVALQSASGAWVRLPEVGTSNQGLANTLRSWLKP